MTYFNWRKIPPGLSSLPRIIHPWCTLCSMLNNDSLPKYSYSNIDSWWFEEGHCEKDHRTFKIQSYKECLVLSPVQSLNKRLCYFCFPTCFKITQTPTKSLEQEIHATDRKSNNSTFLSIFFFSKTISLVPSPDYGD